MSSFNSFGRRLRRGVAARVSAALCVVAVSTLGFASDAPKRFSNGFFDGAATFDGVFSANDAARDDDVINSAVVDAAIDRETTNPLEANDAFAFDGSSAFSVEEFAAVDSFAPIASASAARPTATVGANGFSFASAPAPIVRGSVRLPKLNAIQFWGNGYVGSGNIRPLNWDGKLKDKTTGASIGLTIPLGAISASSYYNYHKNRVTYGSRQVKQKTNLFGLGGYLHAGGFYFALLGTYGSDDYAAANRDFESAIRLGGPTASSFDGWQSSGYFETGYEWPTLGLFVLKPFVSYQYSYLTHDGFDAETLATFGERETYDSCYMTLGSRVDVNLGGLDSFTFQVRTAWVSQLRSENPSMQNFCFGRIPGTVAPSQPYFLGDGAGSDFFWGGAGLRLSLFGALSVAADYDCLVNSRQTYHLGSLGLLVGF